MLALFSSFLLLPLLSILAICRSSYKAYCTCLRLGTLPGSCLSSLTFCFCSCLFSALPLALASCTFAPSPAAAPSYLRTSTSSGFLASSLLPEAIVGLLLVFVIGVVGQRFLPPPKQRPYGRPWRTLPNSRYVGNRKSLLPTQVATYKVLIIVRLLKTTIELEPCGTVVSLATEDLLYKYFIAELCPAQRLPRVTLALYVGLVR